MAHKTIGDLNHTSAAPATHVYDGIFKKIYPADTHRRLLHARKNEPNRFWTSWHDHLLDLSEAKQRETRIDRSSSNIFN